jgi:hypothetical protein
MQLDVGALRVCRGDLLHDILGGGVQDVGDVVDAERVVVIEAGI